ncbi:MAG: DUF4302 domain-containing protein [Muribaculaceae bacterium]|nr:DUF4302 domain-containing protein [Muribaculaceae bacterium]
MKKFLNISLLTLVAISSLSLVSCKNEVDNIFDEDAIARLDKAKAEYSDILTSNGGKWQLEYFANSNEQGYIYLMTFSPDGSVTISGNNKWINYVQTGSNNAPAYGSEVSMWEVIADNGPVLTFNTYNRYFHLFADPYDIPSVGGATSDDDVNENGYGHEGDYEFDIMKYSGDTLYLTGKKYNLNMIMTRVPASVDDEVYMSEVVAMADSFFNAKVPHVYINLPNGVRWIVKNGSTSILKMFREDADEISTAETHNVIITHDGLSFMNPLTIDGFTIQNFIRQSDGSLLCRDDMQTTMTADPLSTMITNTNLIWQSKLTQGSLVGGRYDELIGQLASELKAYNKSTLNFAQIAYDAALSCYVLSFNVKKGTVKYNPSFYFTMTPSGDNQVKLSFAAEGDTYGERYATNCPAMRTFVNSLGSTTIDLSANSLLAPVNMKFAENGNANNFVIWSLQ